MSDFQKFIARLIREHGTATAIADGIEMSLSAFSRLVRNEDTLGVHSCLLLAEFSGESPSKILALAGKGDTAALIERLYGDQHQSLSALDRALVDLDAETKRQLLRLVETLAGRKRRKSQ